MCADASTHKRTHKELWLKKKKNKTNYDFLQETILLIVNNLTSHDIHIGITHNMYVAIIPICFVFPCFPQYRFSQMNTDAYDK